MWVVFDKGNDWSQGYSVASESEAREICDVDTDMAYQYVDIGLLTA